MDRSSERRAVIEAHLLLAGWTRWDNVLCPPDSPHGYLFNADLTSRSCGSVISVPYVRVLGHEGQDFSAMDAHNFWEIIFYLERHKLL